MSQQQSLSREDFDIIATALWAYSQQQQSPKTPHETAFEYGKRIEGNDRIFAVRKKVDKICAEFRVHKKKEITLSGF